MNPVVSILINNYNYGRFLDQAITSAWNQDHPAKEIIVVDDGSTDDSRAVLSRWQDRVQVVFQENAGQGAAINTGFKVSRGNIVCLLDADDIWLPEKVSATVSILDGQPQAGWCCHPLLQVRPGSSETACDPPEMTDGPVDLRDALRRGHEPGTLPATSGLSFRRRLLEQILPMPELRISADNYIKYAAAALAPGWTISRPLGHLLLHGSNAWTGHRQNAAHRAAGYRDIALALYHHRPELRLFALRHLAGAISLYWMNPRETVETPPSFTHRLSELTARDRWSCRLLAAGMWGKKKLASLGGRPATPD